MADAKKFGASPVKWAINFIIPLLLFLIPTAEDGFTSDIRLFLAITLFAIIVIATGNLPLVTIAILLPVCYIVFLGIAPATAFGAWGLEIPWLILGGLIFTVALEKTGFLKRMAYGAILLCGGNFRGILYGILLLGAVLSLIIADMSAKVIIIGAFAVGICKALDLEMGGVNASAIGLATIAAFSAPSYLFLNGSTGTLIPLGLMASAVDVAMPSFSEYLLHMFLPQLVYCFLIVFVIDRFFTDKGQAANLHSKDYFRAEQKKLGKMTRDEKKILIIAIILLVAIATNGIHGIAIGWLFVFSAVALMVPGINLVTEQDVRGVNMGYVIFVASCLGIGLVSVNVGLGAFVSETVYPYIAGSLTRMVGGVWFLGFGLNFVLTPLAAYSAFSAAISEMAVAAGFNPLPILYSFIHALEQVVFPYEYAPVLMIYGMGMCSFGRMVKYNIIRAVLSIVCIFAIFLPYWSLIGLV